MVLVTGGETFLGQRFAEAVLGQDPEAVVVLLCHPDREAMLRDWLESLPSEQTTRCRVEAGFVGSIDLGLSGDAYRALARGVTEILHVDELADETRPFRTLMRRNLEGTREILDFAGSASNLRRFVHLSTVEVSGNRTGVVLETELEAGQGFLDGYQRSKFEAERLVAKWARRIPVTVIRSGLVVGDTEQGRMDPTSRGHAVVEALMEDVPRYGRAPFHVVPWDFLTEFSVRAASDPASVGRVYHVVDPAPLPVEEAARLVARHAHRSAERRGLPLALSSALSRLPLAGRVVRSRRRLPVHLETMVFYNQRHTLAACRRFECYCPPFDEYAGHLVRYVREQWESARVRRPPQAIPDPLEE